MRKLLAIGALVLLAGCMTPQQQEAARQAQLQADTVECQNLGFKPGTTSMGDCILKLREIRAKEANTRAIDRSRMDDWGPWGGPPYYRGYPYWW